METAFTPLQLSWRWIGDCVARISLDFGSWHPALSDGFHVPTANKIDRKLVLGSGVFGIGWGIAGFCPGGALPVVSTMNSSVLVFVADLVFGIWFARPLKSQSPAVPAE